MPRGWCPTTSCLLADNGGTILVEADDPADTGSRDAGMGWRMDEIVKVKVLEVKKDGRITKVAPA